MVAKLADTSSPALSPIPRRISDRHDSTATAKKVAAKNKELKVAAAGGGSEVAKWVLANEQLGMLWCFNESAIDPYDLTN